MEKKDRKERKRKERKKERKIVKSYEIKREEMGRKAQRKGKKWKVKRR